MAAALLPDLQKWYAVQCDEDWERSHGISIQTLQKSGWKVTIDLKDTLLEHKPFEPYEERISEGFWVTAKVENRQFVGAGDPSRLQQIIAMFITWAKTEPNWLALANEEKFEQRQDELFWEALGEEIGPKICVDEGCTHKRIANSLLCRKHHFELIRNKPSPF